MSERSDFPELPAAFVFITRDGRRGVYIVDEAGHPILWAIPPGKALYLGLLDVAIDPKPRHPEIAGIHQTATVTAELWFADWPLPRFV